MKLDSNHCEISDKLIERLRRKYPKKLNNHKSWYTVFRTTGICKKRKTKDDVIHALICLLEDSEEIENLFEKLNDKQNVINLLIDTFKSNRQQTGELNGNAS